MPFRDHWNRMLGKSASSTAVTPNSGSSWHPAFPVLSLSAPTSPTGCGATVTNYTWSTSPSKSSSSTSQNQQHQPELQPQKQQQQQQQQQQHKSKTKRRFKKSSCDRRMHPSERPLTDENLRHQEMFANFTMTFGRSGGSSASSSSSARYSFDGEISPCSSRRGSLIDPRSAAPPPPSAWPVAL